MSGGWVRSHQVSRAGTHWQRCVRGRRKTHFSDPKHPPRPQFSLSILRARQIRQGERSGALGLLSKKESHLGLFGGNRSPQKCLGERTMSLRRGRC